MIKKYVLQNPQLGIKEAKIFDWGKNVFLKVIFDKTKKPFLGRYKKLIGAKQMYAKQFHDFWQGGRPCWKKINDITDAEMVRRILAFVNHDETEDMTDEEIEKELIEKYHVDLEAFHKRIMKTVKDGIAKLEKEAKKVSNDIR